MADPRIEISIDLGDDLPPATAVLGPKERVKKGSSASAPIPVLAITSTPVGVTASYAHVHCLQCGGDAQEFRGIFLESRLSNGVRVLQRRTLKELGPFADLPRKLDLAPPEAVEICSDCFMIDRVFLAAIAQAQAQAELPFAEDTPKQEKKPSRSLVELTEEL